MSTNGWRTLEHRLDKLAQQLDPPPSADGRCWRCGRPPGVVTCIYICRGLDDHAPDAVPCSGERCPGCNRYHPHFHDAGPEGGA